MARPKKGVPSTSSPQPTRTSKEPPKKRARKKTGTVVEDQADDEDLLPIVPVTLNDLQSEQDRYAPDQSNNEGANDDEEEEEDPLARLERETHEQRVLNNANNDRNKSTKRAYAPHIRAYISFFLNYADGRIPSFPILPSKVALFLQWKESSGKAKGGGKYGVTALQQVVSALEQERKNTAYKFPLVPNDILRNDIRIKQLESNWKKDSARRTLTGNSMKAAGGTQEMITETQHVELFKHWFNGHSKSEIAHVSTDFRNLAMFELSCASAHRGANTRELSWSDLIYHEQVLPLAKRSVPTLVLLANNGKTNREGRLDEVGIWRHENPTRCGIFAIALHLFFSDQILQMERPAFAPDFETEDHEIGEMGYRGWYFRTLFPGRMGSGVKDDELYKAMSYPTHYNAFKNGFEATGIHLSNTTHAGRTSAARSATMYNATESDTKAHGGWRDGSSFRSCYNRNLPISAMTALAGFDGRQPESYWIPRAEIAPPEELCSELFPWIEEARRDYIKRAQTNPNCVDMALDGFLNALNWFRSVLLQDLAILRVDHPTAPIFSFAPFNTPQFETFATTLVNNVAQAKDAKTQEFQNLPTHLSDALGTAVGQLVGKMNSQYASITTLLIQLREDQRDTHDAVESVTLGNIRKRARDNGSTLETVLERVEDLSGMIGQLNVDRAPPTKSQSRSIAPRPSQLYQPPPLPPPLRPSHYPHHYQQLQQPQQVSASRQSYPPAPYPSSQASSFPNSTTPPFSPPRQTPFGSTYSQPRHSSPPSPFHSHAFSQPSPSRSPAVQVHPVQSHFPFTHHPTSQPPPQLQLVQPFQPFQPNAHLPQPPPQFVRNLPSFPDLGRPSTILRPTAYERAPDDREQKMRDLHEKFGRRIENMEFLWSPADGTKEGSWIPQYVISSFTTIRKVWEEWDRGKEGCLAVKEIEGLWKTEWRPRNGGSNSTHFAWMKKLASLITEIEKEFKWSEEKVLRFFELRIQMAARKVQEAISNSKTGKDFKADLMRSARDWNGI